MRVPSDLYKKSICRNLRVKLDMDHCIGRDPVNRLDPLVRILTPKTRAVTGARKLKAGTSWFDIDQARQFIPVLGS